MFHNHLRDWKNRPIDEITKAMVTERHRKLGDRPSLANHALRYFRSVWNHARRIHFPPECPTVAVEWYEDRPEGKTIEDLPEWGATGAGLEEPLHRVYHELLLFTGFRKTEALTLQWKHVHKDRVHIPMTKNGRSFDLPILPIHYDVLAPMSGLHR